MGPDTLINFLGWVTLTYCWLYTNWAFFAAIRQEIHDHNKEIRQKVLQEVRAVIDEASKLGPEPDSEPDDSEPEK